MFESSRDGNFSGLQPVTSSFLNNFFGPSNGPKVMDGIELFDADMYMSRIPGGHGGGLTSSFKRCVFLKQIAEPAVASLLVEAMRTHTSPFSYIHLLQGGVAVADVADDATAFCCRD
jgi:hypothetical protein